MPRGDGTGPAGMGSMTGRAAGFCAGYNVPGYVNPVSGRGLGFGRGRGFGRGLGFGRGFGWRANVPYAAPYAGNAPYYPASQYSAKDEGEFLKNQVKYLEEELKVSKERIKEVEASNKKSS